MTDPPADWVLFNPGPVNLADEVRAAALSVDLCHRQPEFATLSERVHRGLHEAAVLPESSHALGLLHGSGTLAVDAALATFVRGRVAVIDNGVYTRRLIDTLGGIADAQPLAFPAGLGRRADPDALARWIGEQRPDWIAMVHHETTTGLLNPIGPVADLAAEAGARLFVDAVSSLGAHPVDPRADVVCFNSNKCLEAVPGIAGVFARRGLPGHDTVPVLDVRRYLEGMPSTPNVPAFLALDAALELLGREDRPRRYERLARAVWRSGSQRFEPLLAEEIRSHVLTSFRLGDRTFEQLAARAHARGYVIYAAQGSLREEAFRVANMGARIDEEVIEDLFATLAS